MFDRPLRDLGVIAFFSPDEGGQDFHGAFFQLGADRVFDGGEGLLFHGNLALGAIDRAELGVEEADEIPQLGDGGDGGFSAALRDALLDGDGGREALEAVDFRLLKLLGELAGVGGHGVEETALALGEKDVEGEGRFPGAGEAGDDDELVARDLDGDVFEVVVAGAAQSDQCRVIGDQ